MKQAASLSKTVLSLDGGGSHFLIQLSMLACLEEETGTSIYDLFDLFAGSSSGGLLTCLITGKQASARDLIQLIVEERILDHFFKSNWASRFFGVLQLRPKYNGESKRQALHTQLGDRRISSLNKKILIPSFNLGQDQLDVFVQGMAHDYLLSEIADACSAAPAYYPAVYMEDGFWRVDGGVGMNNPGLHAYLYAQKCWESSDIKVLSIGSGWRNFSLDGEKTSQYGGLQWSIKGIASIILREQMIANTRITDELLGEQLLYINDDLNKYDLPDDMDSANHPALQQKAIEIGQMWYQQHRAAIKAWLAASSVA